jgi:hypothetical protein
LEGKPPREDRAQRRRGEASPETVRRPNESEVESSDDGVESSDDEVETERKLAREEVDDWEAPSDAELIQ